MKKNLVKKLLAVSLATTLFGGALAGCGSTGGAASSSGDSGSASATEAAPAAEESADSGEAAAEAPAGSTENGTIIWLSNLQSGAQYEAEAAYGEYIAGQYGYGFKIVYGDSFNDPDGNLTAVRNAMTNDVVGIVSSQDGGIKNIVDEYPELYVVGFNTAMDAVYGDQATASDLQTNDHFLGTIADGHQDGYDTGMQYVNAVIDKGYKKVAVVTFPGYAYPNLAKASEVFVEEIGKYNETASEPIEIVGEPKVLEFQPLDESWFLESGNSELDAIVGLCAGTTFIYPTMKTAIADGACSTDTKLLTSGFDSDEAIIADIGGDGVIQYLSVSPIENIGYSLTLLDKALKGEQYDDYANECVDSLEYIIDSTEGVNNVMTKSITGTDNPMDAQISIEDLNAVTSYADLKALFLSDQLTVDALANR